MLQIVDPHSAEAVGRFVAGLLLPFVRSANTGVLPCRGVHARQGKAFLWYLYRHKHRAAIRTCRVLQWPFR